MDHDPSSFGRGEEARAAIVRALWTLHERDMRPPSILQVAEATGLGKTTVRYHLDILAQRGVVRHLDGPRGWMLVPADRP